MTATGWQALADSVPDKNTEVLLLWTYPDTGFPIVRLGQFFMTVFTRENKARHLFKVQLDFGDFSSCVYTDSKDPPTHWHELPALPGEAS